MLIIDWVMALEVGLYRVRIRFERLFADPMIFEETQSLVRRYLLSSGVPRDKAVYLNQGAGEAVPVDDSGKPSAVAGAARYRFEGKRVRSEYMRAANLELDYVDFGSGLSEEDHAGLWKKGRWGEMTFEVKEFHHENVSVDLPEISELYQMLRVRADPTTLASVELPGLSDSLFRATVSYLEERLKRLAEQEGWSVEVYAAKNLTPEESLALEKRLGRESTPSTVHVILSKAPVR